MRAEARAHGWTALLFWAALLTSGCVTLASRPGGGISEEGPRALYSLRETGNSTRPFKASSVLASTKEGGKQKALFSTESGEQERLLRRRSARGLGAALVSADKAPAYEVASAGSTYEGPPSCGGRAVPPGWPDFSSSSDEILAPFLTCTSPGEVLALQERVDMPRLLEALDDWSAVRLGALGPPREDIARQLNEKRKSLLVKAPEAYGRLNAQVLAVYSVDSAYDDDLREILFLLAQDKRLAETLALLPAFQVALEKRGLKPTTRVDRDSEFGDLGRGLARAGKDVLSSSLMAGGGRDFAFLPIRLQLPPEYQEALATAEQELVRNASADSMAVSAFDDLTFGVPLGAYHSVATTLHGGKLLWRGELEEGTREVAPALVLGLIAGGKGLRNLSKAEGAAGVRSRIVSGVEVAQASLRALTETARQFKGAMSLEGLRELVREVRASREAGRFVAVGGADAALALHEAGGDVARARPLMSRAKPGATGSQPLKAGAETGAGEAARPSATKASAAGRLGTLASLVDEGVGHTPAVVEAKLAAAELEATGPRLPKDVGVLEKHRPSLDAPPPEARGNPRWREYVDYYENRQWEVVKGTATEGPLKWAPYERMRAWFARGMAFERDMVKLLREDATRPRLQRCFLGDFDKPRVEVQVGVRKASSGLRYADVLVIEESEFGGRPRRVETFSFKSRNFSELDSKAAAAQMIEDAREALRKYGETLDIRRDSLQRLFGTAGEVPVQRVRLVYEGGALKPTAVGALRAVVNETKKAFPGVEVLFQ